MITALNFDKKVEEVNKLAYDLQESAYDKHYKVWKSILQLNAVKVLTGEKMSQYRNLRMEINEYETMMKTL